MHIGIGDAGAAYILTDQALTEPCAGLSEGRACEWPFGQARSLVLVFKTLVDLMG